VDLIRNYGIFNKINFSVPTDDFLDIYNEFQKELDSHFINFFWINNQDFVSEIITPYGLCMTFNFPKVEDFLNTNSTSDDFHIRHFYPSKVINKSTSDITLPRSISTSIDGLYILLYVHYNYFEVIESDINGLLLFLHDPFELPGRSSAKFIAKSFRPTEINIAPEVHSIDDSLIGYSPEE
jgi:hypothetical protein